jgi:hypothetical protein
VRIDLNSSFQHFYAGSNHIWLADSVTRIEETDTKFDAVKHADIWKLKLEVYNSCGKAPKAGGELRFCCTLINRAMRSKRADSINFT